MSDTTIYFLEMRHPGELRPKPWPTAGIHVDELSVRQWEMNRFLYLWVGAAWHWHDKADWSGEQWRAYAEAPELRTFVARLEGSIVGYYELRLSVPEEVEIAIFGLTPGFVASGLGGALLTDALTRAWTFQPERVWLHTCSQDHPAALPNYLARGMRLYATKPDQPRA